MNKLVSALLSAACSASASRFPAWPTRPRSSTSSTSPAPGIRASPSSWAVGWPSPSSATGWSSPAQGTGPRGGVRPADAAAHRSRAGRRRCPVRHRLGHCRLLSRRRIPALGPRPSQTPVFVAAMVAGIVIARAHPDVAAEAGHGLRRAMLPARPASGMTIAKPAGELCEDRHGIPPRSPKATPFPAKSPPRRSPTSRPPASRASSATAPTTSSRASLADSVKAAAEAAGLIFRYIPFISGQITGGRCRRPGQGARRDSRTGLRLLPLRRALHQPLC